MGASRFQYALLLVCALQVCRADVTLTGRIVDEDSVPVPGALVTLRAAGQTPGQNLQADPTGAFRITSAQAGPYLVTVSRAGFFTLTDRPLAIREGSNEVLLTLNHIRNTSESVDVNSSTTPIDIEQTNSERRLSGTELFEIPYSATHDFRNALPLTPGVLRGPSGDLHFDGGAENQVEYLLDGFNIGDPLGGKLRTHLPLESVRSFEVLGGRYSPEFGKGSTGALSIHTESGDDSWRYSGTNFIPGLDFYGGPRVGAYTPRLSFSGPLVKGRAWFFNTVDANYNQLVVPDLPKGQNTRTSYGASDVLHTQVNLTPSNILFADFLMNFSATPNAGLGVLDPIPTTTDQRGRSWFFSVKDQIYLARGALLEFGFADLRTFARQIPQGHSTYQFTPDGRVGNFYVDSTQNAERKQFLTNLFLPAFRWAGSHEIKTGIDVDRLGYSQSTSRTRFENIGFSGTVLRSVAFGGSGVLERPNLEASFYILDKWKIRDNVFVQTGVRQDWNELVRAVVWSPRVAVAYAPFRHRNTKLSAGYAVTYDEATPQLFSRPADAYSLTTFYDSNGSVQGTPIATVFALGPHLKMPRYQSWTLGLEQLLPGRVFLGVNLLRRRGSDGFNYVNSPNSAPLPLALLAASQDIGFESVLRLENSRRDSYDSAEIRLSQPFGKGYEWMASYTRSRAFSNAVVDVTVDQPMLISNNVGRLPWDAPNRFLSWGYLPTPWRNWAVAYLFEARNGFPFSVVDETSLILGSPNTDRFPAYLNLNFHAERTLSLIGYRFALRGGFNNITNHNNSTVVNNTFGSPHFRTFYGSEGRHFVVRLRWLGRAKS